jgi:hypothetical protein
MNRKGKNVPTVENDLFLKPRIKSFIAINLKRHIIKLLTKT